MSGQGSVAHTDGSAAIHPCTDTPLLDAAAAVITEFGYSGLTLARLAEAAGTSRMTLHRREITLPAVVAGLSIRAAAELRDALFPVLTTTGVGFLQLQAALNAVFDVADRHLLLLAGLFSDDAGVFHAPPDATGALPTNDVFIAPLEKLIADGERDGSIAVQADRTETATVLFNTAGWGYVQLRHAQQWPIERARTGILNLVMSGLGPQASHSHRLPRPQREP